MTAAVIPPPRIGSGWWWNCASCHEMSGDTYATETEAAGQAEAHNREWHAEPDPDLYVDKWKEERR